MKLLNKYIDKLIDARVKEKLPEAIQSYLATDEALAIIYSIISLRGEFMYNLARKMSDNPPPPEWYYEQEQKTLTDQLIKVWPNKSKEEIETLVKAFYNK